MSIEIEMAFDETWRRFREVDERLKSCSRREKERIPLKKLSIGLMELKKIFKRPNKISSQSIISTRNTKMFFKNLWEAR
jgi:hypothetical protein